MSALERTLVVATASNLMVSDERTFWNGVWKALQRLIALAIFGVAHRILNALLRWVAPANVGKALVFIEDVLFVAFVLVYVYLVYEMVAVFIPAIERRRVPEVIQQPGGAIAQGAKDDS